MTMTTQTSPSQSIDLHVEAAQPSRRGFLKQTSAGAVATWAGGLSLGFYLPPAVADKLATDGPQAGAADINAWIRISPDNRVFCQVSRSEMGQGTSTSLPMMLAEELECRWEDVRMEFASVNEHLARNKVYVTFSTGGSRGRLQTPRCGHRRSARLGFGRCDDQSAPQTRTREAAADHS